MIIGHEPRDVTWLMSILERADPWVFESLCAGALPYVGFDYAEATKGSDDHGVDILALRGQEHWAIQCKRWTPNRYVDTSAVKQVISGALYYGCTHAAVLTTTLFSPKAEDLAEQYNIYLWDRYQLYYLIESQVNAMRAALGWSYYSVEEHPQGF